MMAETSSGEPLAEISMVDGCTPVQAIKSASDKLNAIARYLPETEFKALFAADSVRNAEAVKKAGITQ